MIQIYIGNKTNHNKNLKNFIYTFIKRLNG